MENHKQIVELVEKFVSTIHCIIKKSIKLNEHRTNRSNKRNRREEKVIIREIKKDPNSSTTKLAEMIPDSYKKDVHLKLDRKILRDNDFRCRFLKKTRQLKSWCITCNTTSESHK